MYAQWSVCAVAAGSEGANGIQIVSYRPDQGKVVQEKLEKFWVPGSRIRINNKSDRTMAYHSEEEIKQQVTYVRRVCCVGSIKEKLYAQCSQRKF